MNTLLERLQHRVAVQPLNKIKDCCVAEVVKRFPSMLGTSHSCIQCGEMLKAVSATDFSDQTFLGALRETRRETMPDDVIVGTVWFSKDKWTDMNAAIDWCKERDIKVTKAEEHYHAYELSVAPLKAGSTKGVIPATGVLVEIGLPFEKTLTTAALLGGGHINPLQGGYFSKIFRVSTETKPADADSHIHPIDARIATDAGGPMLLCRTGVVKDHAHDVRIPVIDGSINGSTEPSASIVGGHSHKHAISWFSRVEQAEPKKSTTVSLNVSPQNIANLRRAASMLDVIITNKEVDKTSGVPKGEPKEIELTSDDVKALKEVAQKIRDLADRWAGKLNGENNA